MSYASDTEDFGDVGGARWIPGDDADFDSDSASEYTQSDDDDDDDDAALADQGVYDDDDAGETDEEVEDRPPSDDGRDDLDQQGAVQFDRLIKSIKSTTDLTSATPFLQQQPAAAGAGGPTDDDPAEDVDDDFMSGLRAATGVGKRKNRQKRGHRQPSPSPAAQDLLGKANLAYVTHDWLSAIHSFQQVIHEEPAVPAAWIGLGMCHRELGNPEKALQCEVVGAHLVKSGETWKELAKKSRDAGATMQAMYCYKKALEINPKDVDALWDRSVIFREIGEHVKAIEGFGLILNQFPNDVAILQEMAHSFVEAGRIPLGQRLILTALHSQQARFPLPALMPDPAELFSIPVIVILFDLLFATGKYAQALAETKKAVRWLQGRHDDVRWAKKDNDSEFDVAGYKRGPHAEPAPGYPLDINVRQRLGLVRLKLNHVDEARRHFEFIKALDPATYMVFWSEVAAAYLDARYYDDAIVYYEALAEITSDPAHVEGRGDCLRAASDYEGASESYEFAAAAFEDDGESLSRVQLKLAAVYEPLGRRKEALELVKSVLERQQKSRAQAEADDEDALLGGGPAGSAPGGTGALTSFFDEEKQLRDKARVAALHRKRERELASKTVREESMLAKVQAGFGRLAQLDEAVDAGAVEAVEEWLEIARELVEGFRQTKVLFPSDRNTKYTGIDSKGNRPGFRSRTFKKRSKQRAEDVEDEANAMSKRLQREIDGDAVTADDFDTSKLRGVAIDRWFDMCIKFCCLLAKFEEAEYAVEVADHLSHSNLFRTAQRQETLRITAMACQMRIPNSAAMVDSARRVFMLKQFNNAAIHLLVSTLDAGVGPIEALSNYNLQKTLLRELKLWKSTPDDGKLIWNAKQGRWHPAGRTSGLKMKSAPAAASASKAAAARRGSADDDEDDDDEDDDDEHDTDADPKRSSSRSSPTKSAAAANDPAAPAFIPRPTKPSPVLFNYYGALMMVAKSYQSAMYYLTHAHIIDPWDPLVCFQLALCYLGRAFQRQCDNRNHCIAQMVAFLDKYRANHPLGPDCDEVDYNYGTVFHRLGLFHLAKIHFTKVLDRAEQDGRTGAEPGSLVRETAFNLSLIHNMTPAPAEAKRILRKWISI